ncbi:MULTISPECIES: NAD(P)H-dependent oxidoreductase [Burkholderia]|uniref:FMN-dependent NADH-azoreductase n=1 Tax=Burkholderia TaxID=32008 RepID=UPI0004D7404F|nr:MULTISPECIES: NAD(P)H-dependent oxidoreductase [Burkholderia]KER72364.1 FMN-dependent NADH-azoreductase [Burkholderia cepacia]
MNLLHVDSSITGQNSVTRKLTAAITHRLREANPSAVVTYRDLAAEPVRHLSSAPAGDSEMLDEFLSAEVVVIGAPMHNLGVPSQLKAWLDWLTVAGKTFRYSEAGPLGLCGGKRIIVASSRGGVYSAPSPMASMDHQESHLQSFFSFLGITHLEIIRAEGTAIGEADRQLALENALAAVSALETA